MGPSEKPRKDRLRRKLGRMGHRPMKSAVLDPDNRTFGGYMIVEPLRNFVVAGQDGNARRGQGLDLDGIEAWIDEHRHALTAE